MDEQDRFAEFERKMEALSKRMDDLAERAGQRVEATFTRKVHTNNGRAFWGGILILAGLIWYANRMGWFYFDIPIAATALIVLGLYMIFTSRR